MIRVAISGFGRIGRTFLRTVLADQSARANLQIVAINSGPAKKEMLAHMFKYDTIMGTYPGDVRYEHDTLYIDNLAIVVVSSLDPAQLPWKSMNIDWVVESSGKFTDRAGAQKHSAAGAKKVLITAPAKNPDVTIIPGVNDTLFDNATHQIVSLGSCTTNAFATMLKVLHDAFQIESCMMTTTHAYTNTQVLLDVEGEDPRRSRAAALNIIPTTTGAMKIIDDIIPSLAGKVHAVAIRVPVPVVSLIDLTCTTTRAMSVAAINDVFARAAKTMPNVFAITHEALVSSDFIGDSHSVIIDSLLTSCAGERQAKVFGWYDNEWGYSCRLRDFLMSCKR